MDRFLRRRFLTHARVRALKILGGGAQGLDLFRETMWKKAFPRSFARSFLRGLVRLGLVEQVPSGDDYRLSEEGADIIKAGKWHCAMCGRTPSAVKLFQMDCRTCKLGHYACKSCGQKNLAVTGEFPAYSTVLRGCPPQGAPSAV
jgi:hypothetical protein